MQKTRDKFYKALKLDRVLKSRFIKNNIIFFSGSMTIALFNYLYHPVLGRLMPVEDFGEVQTLISLAVLITMFLTVFGLVAINVVSNEENVEEKVSLLKSLEKLAFYISIALFVLIIVFSNNFKEVLNFKTYYPFISLACILLISVPLTFKNAFLQGTHDFKAVSITGILNSSGKLFFGALFVVFGWRSFGAITGLVIAQVFALAYVFYKTKQELKIDLHSANMKIRKLPPKKEIKYGFLVLVVFMSTTLLYTADVILIKSWFPAKSAGLYSGVATIARIIFFASSSVSGVMLPSIKIDAENSENNRVLIRSLIIIFLIGSSIFIVFVVAPELVIRILMGNKFLPYANLLPLLSFQLFLVSVINLMFFYYLALRKNFAGIIACSGVLSILGLSYLNHKTIQVVVYNFLAGSLLIIGLIIAWFCYNYFRYVKSDKG